jgi:hypothetical protein
LRAWLFVGGAPTTRRKIKIFSIYDFGFLPKSRHFWRNEVVTNPPSPLAHRKKTKQARKTKAEHHARRRERHKTRFSYVVVVFSGVRAPTGTNNEDKRNMGPDQAPEGTKPKKRQCQASGKNNFEQN